MNANEPLRILIVDDELPARNRMRELLEDCRGEVPNVMVGEAANGLAALDAVATEKPDVVLVDIHMPGMSGIELAGHLQVLDSPPAVVFVTAHDQYAVDAFEVNAIDYLLKPVRAARLVVALKKSAVAVAGPAVMCWRNWMTSRVAISAWPSAARCNWCRSTMFFTSRLT